MCTGTRATFKVSKARLILSAGETQTTWGSASQSLLSARLFPATNDLLAHAEIKPLRAQDAKTEWASARSLDLQILLRSTDGGTNVGASLELNATNIDSRWVRSPNAHFSATWNHSFTNAVPMSGQAQLHVASPDTKWGRARDVNLSARLIAPTGGGPPLTDASWSWWAGLAPYWLDAECRIAELDTPTVKAEEVSAAGQWRAPNFDINQLSARLYGGNLEATSRVDVATRDLSFAGGADVDERQIASLLSGQPREWLSQFSWEKPPQLQFSGALTLPEWTNRQPGWSGEGVTGVRLAGHFTAGKSGFRGLTVNSAESHFSFSNFVWQLPDLVVKRPEGRLDVSNRFNTATREFYYHIHSTMDPRAVIPLVGQKPGMAIEDVVFTTPPTIDGEVRGRWGEGDTIGVRAQVAATNFQVRGESFDTFQSALEYTNLQLLVLEPRLTAGQQHGGATAVGINFAIGRLYFTNAGGVGDPQMICRMIGPKVAENIAPYHFLGFPTVRADGMVSFHHDHDVDLRFDVEGGPFEWWRFKSSHVAAHLQWVGQRLLVENVMANFYDGTDTGSGAFDFRPQQGAEFKFDATIENADLHSFMRDFTGQTNRLEGRVTGRLVVTQASSEDWRRCGGGGNVTLRDGMIWEIPVFGVLSPALDAVVPGLGNSRARSASASFTITNGVISSDNLEIQAWIARLQYRGTVDLRGRVDARVYAELLRNTWLLGPVMSVALWPVSKVFEHKVTGSLENPKTAPVFIPKLLLVPFHPLRALKELLPSEPAATSTNWPAAPSGH